MASIYFPRIIRALIVLSAIALSSLVFSQEADDTGEYRTHDIDLNNETELQSNRTNVAADTELENESNGLTVFANPIKDQSYDIYKKDELELQSRSPIDFNNATEL